MAPDLPELFLGPMLPELQELVELEPEVITDLDAASDGLLSGIDVLITGWQAPRVSRSVLDRMPRLRAVVHTGGSVKGHLDPEVWRRGVHVTSATAANALPVAEYTLAMVLLATKRVMPIATRYTQSQEFVDVTRDYRDIGAYGTRVGIIGASTIGRRLLELMRPLDLRPIVYDPYVEAEVINLLDARKAPLDEVMRSGVVTIHAPSTPETRHLVGATELGLMPSGATLINTARGSLLDHDALLAEVATGRLSAVLDVTEPEPLPPGHPFYSLPNVLLTPHLAGSHGNELRRMGRQALDEVGRLVRGEPVRHPVPADLLATIA